VLSLLLLVLLQMDPKFLRNQVSPVVTVTSSTDRQEGAFRY
jgi:hypothetical protein